jgi:hypothetical protein
MKIYNRKLAARIARNESYLNKLLTERRFDPTADQFAVETAIASFRAEIARDSQTLLQHGYDNQGRRNR